MKVVINSCFGGFGLSTEAAKRLIAMGSPHIKQIPIYEYYRNSNSRREMKDAGDGYEVGSFGYPLVKDGIVFCEQYGDDNTRACPLLVQVVEEMGEAADGDCAEMKVVEIPDGIDWMIDEYDGMESVEEKHRWWD